MTGRNDSQTLRRTYLLQSRDGDYVKSAKSGNTETVKMFFTFTKSESQAKRFHFDDLYPPQATTCVGMEFVKGFAGGKMVRIL